MVSVGGFSNLQQDWHRTLPKKEVKLIVALEADKRSLAEGREIQLSKLRQALWRALPQAQKVKTQQAGNNPATVSSQPKRAPTENITQNQRHPRQESVDKSPGKPPQCAPRKNLEPSRAFDRHGGAPVF
ncbi:MAG: hypothetical protein M2R45_02483 [Verrucomicrobia subdivision 3 bacterium]|nr:hypothetical protein [Limisphaerales bacterium]MCS1413272.1 hypothetical protein [Limisphaerales bacterium]